MIRPLDRDRLRQQYLRAEPFPHLILTDFLDPALVAEAAASYPTFASAERDGLVFKTVNEQRKVQLTDSGRFPQAVRRLSDALASPGFLADLEYITGIPLLLADDELNGGGIHITGPGGRLDVHVDFNFLEHRKLHRRLNLLLYMNAVWEDSWGGHIELWDREVKRCAHRMTPALNRCLIFETSDHSYHGVAPVLAPSGVERRSFAAYYYTREAPPNWDGQSHDTQFRARPDERLRGYVLMPAERLKKRAIDGLRRVKRRVKSLLLGPG